MEKKKIKLKTRFLISIVLGILAFILGVYGWWGEPFGDTPGEIKEVELSIERLCSNIGKDITDINDKTKAASQTERIEGGIRLYGYTGEQLSFWERLEYIIGPLECENQIIAMAKALTYCKENPVPQRYVSQQYLWNDRYEISKREWVIPSFNSKVLMVIGIASLFCIGTIIGIFLILTIIPWLWYFLLGRISELSQAIQGK